MAIILGTKIVKDLPENDRVAIGITLPLRRGGSGYFAQSFQTSEQIKTNLKNLFLTQPGERLMQPNFGTRLYELLFSQNTDQLESAIELAIDDAIRKWMPFVTITHMDVNRDLSNKDRYIFQISIQYSVFDQQNLETLTFNISQ